MSLIDIGMAGSLLLMIACMAAVIVVGMRYLSKWFAVFLPLIAFSLWAWWVTIFH